ncbi:MAG: hypothetical protein WAT53_07665 [Nitrosomonas sp.]|jgi:hypothetical protein|nr:hypothetical protein [Nitrosomonas sp.]MCC7135749.1 hypothetical protein [Nitrosomonas sp.]
MPHTAMGKQEISMLRTEVEILMRERHHLLKTVGATASFVSSLNFGNLPGHIRETASQLSACLNALPEETLRDALESQRKKIHL